jgi:hypothetical protein
MLLRNMQMKKSDSLQSFKDYRQSESQNPQQVGVYVYWFVHQKSLPPSTHKPPCLHQ